MGERFIPSNEKISTKETKRNEPINTVNPVTKEVISVPHMVKIIKRFFRNQNIDNYRKCSKCGGYTAPSRRKTLRWQDTHCLGCGEEF